MQCKGSSTDAKPSDSPKPHPSDQPLQMAQQFSVVGFKVLIICRGPIRKEVMDVLTEMGASYGILLSEKDSVAYKNALAPELRQIKDPRCIHRVPDYTGADKPNGMPASPKSLTLRGPMAITEFSPATDSWRKKKP